MLCYPVNHSIVLIGMQDVVMGLGFGFSLCLVGHSGIGIGVASFLLVYHQGTGQKKPTINSERKEFEFR